MNQLEQQLETAIKDPKQTEAFIQNLLQQEVYCLGHLIEEEPQHSHEHGGGCCQHDTEVSIMHWEDSRGNSFVPFFTSLDAMTEVVGEDEHYLCVQGLNFLALTEGETLLLNPESDLEWSFSAKEVREILQSQGL
ncbi:MAG: sseB [Gammaproteobacteria bacterium]|jgi:hypothetical protein|nr:sseB [Gammaproteobacteria bacterium]